MRKISFLFCIINICVTFCQAQNVGIGTSTPSEKLDVNGNMNLGGNLRVNGTGGQAGQVLMTNTNGSTGWGDISNPDPCQYKNFVTLVITGETWTVPANTHKVLIQVWGAGGGGNAYASGGGGGYATAHFGVNPGNTVTVNFGVGGAGSTTTNAGNGSTTSVVVADSFNTSYTVYATGGSGAGSSGTFNNPGNGGSYTINPGYYNFMGRSGQQGVANTYSYQEKAASIFIEIVQGGDGGNAGNADAGGGRGGNLVPGGRYAPPLSGIRPGGGGGGSASVTTNGGNGGAGYVIIWY